MARFPSSTTIAPARAVGAWLHPATSHRPRSEAERRIQVRAGIVGLTAIATGLLAVAAAAAFVGIHGIDPVPQDQQFGLVLLPAGMVLVAVSVFAPQALFRTRNAMRTRQVLTNPSNPLPPWSSTTITFDAVLVGALLAGVYFDGALALTLFGLALIARVVLQSTRQLDADPNARYHAVTSAWGAGVTGTAAFLIVKPLIPSIDEPAPAWPLVFAALAAMFMGLALNAVQRWVNLEHSRWAFARDAVDSRRIIVALVSALIAWLVSYGGIIVDNELGNGDPWAGTMTGLGIFVVAWLALWYASIRLWQRDALRTMALWSAHQAEITGRLTDGSLDPELALRAGVRVTTRMAISIFGATRAFTVLKDDRGVFVTDLVGVDVHPNGPAPNERSLISLPHVRMPIFALPGHSNTTSVTVAGWLWPGWFLTRSRAVVQRFTDLASQTLLVPVVASEEVGRSAAFDEMFTRISHWPSLAAFEEAVSRMSERTDASPQSHSLLIAVYAIDEFGTLAGGKFEQVAVGQVMRLALGHQDFAGHDVFVAYEDPGRLWVALGGGPIIRTGIELLRGLQQHINDHGSVPSARLDVDVHVSVSFGYAAHQVDDFSFDGLLTIARDRLATDQAARDPFTIDNMLALDFSPADIIDAPDTPITSMDVAGLLVADAAAQLQDGARRFPLSVTPVSSVSDGALCALVASVGWQRSIGALDASTPDSFRQVIGRQVNLAAEGARVILQEVKDLLASALDAGRPDMPVLVWMPAVLLSADAGTAALPNLMTPFLNRAECARTVILLDTIPPGSGQALRLLADRGTHIAVTAGAAAGADAADLFGWQRWAILFPAPVTDGTVDALTIQQTASAIANQDTHLIAVAGPLANMRELEANNIHWIMAPGPGILIEGQSALRDELLG